MAFLKQLYVQVIIAILLAIVFGLAFPDAAVKMKPLGVAFIALLKMMLGPIIFCTVVLGLTHVSDMRQLGRLALKSLIYFEILTTLGMLLGFIAVNLFQPGNGLHATNLAMTSEIEHLAKAGEGFTAVKFFLGIIPSTLVDAFAKGNILQILFVSLLVGGALSIGGTRDSALLRGIEEGQAVLFRILGFLMRFAPIGAFGALAAAIGEFGGITLIYLIKLVALFYATCLIFVLGVLGLVAAHVRLSIFQIIRLVRDELVIVVGTASGESILPRLMVKLEQAGCDKAVVGFVLPAGYSFNLDGTGIYMAMAVGFIAQATDTPFGFAEQAAVLAVMLLTSKGGSIVAGGAFVKLAGTLQTVRSLPLNGLGLLFAVDRFMSTCITMTNLVSNAVAVMYIAKSEGVFDDAKFKQFLADQRDRNISMAGESALPDEGNTIQNDLPKHQKHNI